MAHQASKTATLSVDGTTIELPVYTPTEGQDVIDIGALTSKGYFTYDPGFVSTASCDSNITYIDGDQGILLHRGYPIDQLAEHSDHLEVCYLLLNGELPNAAQKADFERTIKGHMSIDDDTARLFNGFGRDAHPMAKICSAVGALAGVYHAGLDIDNAADREVTAHRLIAKIVTLASMVYKHSIGEDFIAPRKT